MIFGTAIRVDPNYDERELEIRATSPKLAETGWQYRLLPTLHSPVTVYWQSNAVAETVLDTQLDIGSHTRLLAVQTCMCTPAL